jgi:predicted lipoprotein
MTLSRSFASCLFGLALAACAKEEPLDGHSAVGALVRNITEQQILVDVSAFADSATLLRESADAFCGEPNDEGLDRLRADWQTSAEAWYRAQLFKFGPADADPVLPLYTFIDSLRLRGTDYADSASLIQETWRGSADELDAAFFEAQRFNDVGLLAVEVALFETSELAQAYADEPRRCNILVGLSGELERRAIELRSGWTESFAGAQPFSERMLERKLPDGRSPLVQIIISAQEYVDYLHRRGVVNLAGRLSQTGWPLVEKAVDGIDDLLSAELEGGNIYYYMAELGSPESVDKVKADLDAVRAALAANDAEALASTLAIVDGDFKREIPDALGLDLGLTLTDGD